MACERQHVVLHVNTFFCGERTGLHLAKGKYTWLKICTVVFFSGLTAFGIDRSFLSLESWSMVIS